MGKHFSFSQLTAFESCPYMYYLEKIVRVPQEENAFSQLGTIVHELIEGWAKGEIAAKDLPDEFEMRYFTDMTKEFPNVLAKYDYTDKSYAACMDYFKTFDEFKGYKVIAAEKGYETLIAGQKFVGYVDLILEDSNGGIIICDHKSKSESTFKRCQQEMWRQQYCYSKFIYEETGRYPSSLMFNLFKAGGVRPQKEFNIEEYNATISWAEDVIHRILTCDAAGWHTKKDEDFFCRNICSVRESCLLGV